jgi:ACS family hexuronate transporter-like MFS transporter
MNALSAIKTVPAAPSASSRVGQFRWAICALLFFACVVNYMDRQILGLLKPDLMKLLNWTEKDYGIIAICFQASYAVGQTAFGPIMNRFGTKATYAFSMTFWSLAAMAHALMRTVFGFGFARVALGLGESGNYPAAIKTVTEWFPPKERSVATGIFNAGSNVGSIFAPLLVPWLFFSFGWKAAFVAIGACGFLWLIFWLLLFDAPAKSRRVHASELTHINSGVAPTAETPIPWMELLGYREAWAYYGTCVLVGPVWWFYGFWLPGFFHDHFNLDIRGFGLPLAVIGGVTGLGSIAGGGLSAWFLKRGWSVNRARKTASFVCACCTLPVILTPRVSNVWLATTFFALAAAAHQGWSATMYSTVADIFPKPAVASVVGFGGSLASVVSLGFFWLVSTILQDQGKYGLIMLICGSAYVIAWLIFQAGVPQIKTARIT